jgi:hypothetical protein
MIVNSPNEYTRNENNHAETKFLQLSAGLSKKQVNLGQLVLTEWHANKNKQEVIQKWRKETRRPSDNSITMTILHYNIQYFYSNQCALLDIIAQHNPTIISLNELGTSVPHKTIKQLIFSYNIFMSKGTNAHGGVVLAIDKKVNAIPLNIEHLHIVAVQVIIKHIPSLQYTPHPKNHYH